MNNNEMPRRKGFSLLSFFLGILLGIILVIGTVAGVVLYALNGKIDDVMNSVGVPNKDENGNNIYINTDKDSGGAETLLQLIDKVYAFTTDAPNLSVAQVENLLPAVSGMVDNLCNTLNNYVEIDRAELASTPFSEFGVWVQDKILSVQPASVLDLAGMGGALDNKIVSLLLEGREANYVENGSQKYPAYYDTYTVSGAAYVRGDGQPLQSGLESALVEKNGEYRLYFYEYNGRNYITDETFAFTAPVLRSVSGVAYTPSQDAKLSGNYYYKGSEKITVKPITLRDFSDGEFAMLNEVYITDFLEEGSSELAEKALDGISLGDVVNGRLDLNEALSNLTLADIIENISVTDAVMVSLAYKVSRVTEVIGHSYSHTGLYKSGDTRLDVFIESAANGNVERVYYTDNGKEIEIPSTSVRELMEGINVDELISEFTVADFVDITPNDTIVAYLAYGIYGIDPELKTAFAEIGGEEMRCTILTDAHNIITSVLAENGEKVYGFSINELTGSVGTIVDKLTLNDIMDVSGNALLEKLGDKKISELPEALNDITVGDIIDTEGNSMLEKLKDYKISELGDGINELTVGDIVDPGENKLLSFLADKKIAELSTAIDDITIGDVVDPGENKLLQRLENEKISELSTVIDNLTVGDVVETEAGTILYHLKDYKITEIGSGIDELTIGEIVGDTEGNNLLNSLKDTQIKDLSKKINDLKVGDVMEIEEGTFLLSEFKDTKIIDLPNEIGRVSINTVYAEDIYSVKDKNGNIIVPAKRELATEYHIEYLYYELREDGKYQLINSGTGKLTESDFVSGKYYTYGAPKGVWKTLLYNKGVEKAYTIEDLDKLMTNVANNVSSSTLRDLTEIGILELDDTQLGKKIYYYDSVSGTFKQSGEIGDMELTALIEFIIDNVTTQPSIPSIPGLGG